MRHPCTCGRAIKRRSSGSASHIRQRTAWSACCTGDLSGQQREENPNTCPTTLTVRRVADTTIVVPSDTSTSSTTLPRTSTSTCFEGGPFELELESTTTTTFEFDPDGAGELGTQSASKTISSTWTITRWVGFGVLRQWIGNERDGHSDHPRTYRRDYGGCNLKLGILTVRCPVGPPGIGNTSFLPSFPFRRHPTTATTSYRTRESIRN